MLPRSRRLPRAGFEQAGLTRAASPHFSISFGEGRPLKGGAVVVSKKVAKSSAGRHLLKRRVRETVRPWVLPGRALIIHARPGADQLPFPELKAELEALLRQSLGSGSM